MSEPRSQDQRRSPRYSCILEARLAETPPVQFKPAWPIRVLNISTGGIGLHCGERFDVGTVLTLGLHSSSNKSLAPIQVRVVHVTEKANGTYELGAAFLQEISAQAVQDLLA